MPKPGVITIPAQTPKKTPSAPITLPAGPQKVVLQNPFDPEKTCVICDGAIHTGSTIVIHGETTIGPADVPSYFVPPAVRKTYKTTLTVRTTAAVTVTDT